MIQLRRFVRNDLAELHQNNVRVRIIGERVGLEPDIDRLLQEAEDLTRANTGLLLVVAFNYGGRQEIARAARRVAEQVASGTLAPGDITADLLGKHLDAPDLPDPDLIIRTSGEQRLSNFLMWQSAYSELVFVPTYWPDFDRGTLETAIAEYWRRERRFSGNNVMSLGIVYEAMSRWLGHAVAVESRMETFQTTGPGPDGIVAVR